jgi:hypothetical protein
MTTRLFDSFGDGRSDLDEVNVPPSPFCNALSFALGTPRITRQGGNQ